MDLKWEEVREKLRLWREENSRHSEEVIELWTNCLENKKFKLGDERWMVEEQVFIAGLDCGRLEVADKSFIALSKQFPGSARVYKLKAMRLESLERFDDALSVYDAILRDDETNSTARKRRVAVLRAAGRSQDALRELTDYLNKFMSDGEAWQEASEAYMREGDCARAAFCMEELIVANPHNHLYYTRFAEIKFTQGGLENLELAKSYFTMAAKLNPGNTRALYGLLMSCANVYSNKIPTSKKKELQKLSEWAQKQLVQKYKKNENDRTMSQAHLTASLAALSFNDRSSF